MAYSFNISMSCFWPLRNCFSLESLVEQSKVGEEACSHTSLSFMTTQQGRLKAFAADISFSRQSSREIVQKTLWDLTVEESSAIHPGPASGHIQNYATKRVTLTRRMRTNSIRIEPRSSQFSKFMLCLSTPFCCKGIVMSR